MWPLRLAIRVPIFFEIKVLNNCLYPFNPREGGHARRSLKVRKSAPFRQAQKGNLS